MLWDLPLISQTDDCSFKILIPAAFKHSTSNRLRSRQRRKVLFTVLKKLLRKAVCGKVHLLQTFPTKAIYMQLEQKAQACWLRCRAMTSSLNRVRDVSGTDRNEPWPQTLPQTQGCVRARLRTQASVPQHSMWQSQWKPPWIKECLYRQNVQI